MDSSTAQYILDTVNELEPYRLIYCIHSYIMCVFNTILVIITLYYIKNFKVQFNFELKPLTIYNIMCCWILVTFSTLNSPAALAKIGGGFSFGIGVISPRFMIVCGFFTSWAAILQLSIISTFGFLLQFSRMQVIKTNIFIRILQWFNTSRRIWLVLHSTLFFHSILLLIPSIYRYVYSVDLYSQNLSHSPELQSLVLKNASFVITLGVYSPVVQWFITFIFALIFMELFVSVLVNFFTFRAIQSTKFLVKKATLKRQMLLYKLFSMQILLNVIFFYLPVFVAALIKMKGLSSAYFMPLNISLLAWHYPIQFLLNLIQFPKIRKIFGGAGNKVVNTNSIPTRS